MTTPTTPAPQSPDPQAVEAALNWTQTSDTKLEHYAALHPFLATPEERYVDCVHRILVAEVERLREENSKVHAALKAEVDLRTKRLEEIAQLKSRLAALEHELAPYRDTSCGIGGYIDSVKQAEMNAIERAEKAEQQLTAERNGRLAEARAREEAEAKLAELKAQREEEASGDGKSPLMLIHRPRYTELRSAFDAVAYWRGQWNTMAADYDLKAEQLTRANEQLEMMREALRELWGQTGEVDGDLVQFKTRERVLAALATPAGAATSGAEKESNK